ncbi:MAG: hypothetical protein AAF517_07945 [Planctomycetota bacterium]
MNLSELTEIFRKLGADDAEIWAASQVEEGIPQLARFLFLKGAWDVVSDESGEWIDNVLANTPEDSKDAYSGQAHAIRKMLACGVSREWITDLVRCAEANMIFQLGYLLDDPGSVEGNEHVDWALVQVDENGEVCATINGLHESVLEMDPTGREMRPRDD